MTEPAKVSIRLANDEDLDLVANIWHESASQMDDAAIPMPTRDELRSRIDAELLDSWLLNVAVFRERVVGLLAIKRSEEILDQIFVLPGEQRKGIGKALLDQAKALMPSGFTLRMAAANHRAGRFYENEGLIKVREGTHPSSGRAVRYYAWRPSE